MSIGLEHQLRPLMGIPKKDGRETLYKFSPCCNTHDDKFTVNWEKERWICNHQNTCGRRGNLISLANLLGVTVANKTPYHQNDWKPVKHYKPNKVKVEPVEIEDKTEVNFNERQRHLEALFSPDDHLVFAKDSNYAVLIESNQIDIEYDSDNYTHFKVNHGGAKADDIKDFKYTLVECDEIADLTKQKEFLLGLNLPIASLTYSGNKSLHAVVKIQARDRKEYDRRVNLVHEVCGSVGFPIDKTKDPCRFTRLAGAINPSSLKSQVLLDLNIGSESWYVWEEEYLPTLETTQHTISTADFESRPVEAGFSSGFLTHDYNDSGLKGGGLTLLTGQRNQGKTTFARQIMIATASQELKVYAYMGEGEPEREKGYLERLVACKGELEPHDNTYGRVDYIATKPAQNRFNDKYAPFIDFYNKPLTLKGKVFDSIFTEMQIKAKQGTVLFVIDNMMKLTADQKETFKSQQIIIAKLKEFAVHYKVHIILIAHPRKDGTSISGAMEQENTADTILKFMRCDANSAQAFINYGINPEELSRVTAIVTNEKVRDGGTAKPMFMEFDATRQANIDIVYLPDLYQMASDYRRDNMFSRETIYQ